MNDLRTSIILDLTGNIGAQSRRFGRDLEKMGTRGARAVSAMQRGLQAAGRGLDRMANRYTAFITGAGGIATVRMVGNLESRFTRLGIQANVSGENIQKLKEQIFSISQAPDIRIDPSQLTSAVEEIVEKTGDLDFAKDNLRNLAAAIQATGAEGSAIGGIAAEFQKMGLTRPRDVLEALDILTVQGKQGAFTLQSLAALGPRVFTAYAAMGRTGLPAIREMGAALQMIRQGTGSPEMAATAFEGLMRVLSNADKVKALQQGGIKVFETDALGKATQVLRPINELLAEIIQRAQGKTTVLSKIIGDEEALRAFKSAITEYRNFGAIPSLDKFYSVQADGTTILKDSARAARDFNAALTMLNTAWRQFADRELSGHIGHLADYLNSLKPGTVQRWLNIAKTIGMVAGGAIAARKAWTFGRGLLSLFRGNGSMAGGIGANSPGPGVVPVYVVNKHLSLLNSGKGFGIGTGIAGGATGTAAGGGTSALLAAGAALAPALVAATTAAISLKAGKEIANKQISMLGTTTLEDMLSKQMVMGAGPQSYSYRRIQAEIARRRKENDDKINAEIEKAINAPGMARTLKTTAGHQRLLPSHQASSLVREMKNMDLSLAPAHRRQDSLRQEKMSGEMTITFDHRGLPKVTRLASKNLDIDVDTGRTMVSPP